MIYWLECWNITGMTEKAMIPVLMDVNIKTYTFLFFGASMWQKITDYSGGYKNPGPSL